MMERTFSMSLRAALMLFAAVSTVMVVVQCGLYAVLCNPAIGVGLVGVPIADFVYYATCCIVLTVMLHRMLGSIGLGSVVWLAVRAIVATLVACAVAILISRLLPLPFGTSIVNGLVRLLVCGSIGLVVAYGLCAVFRIPEMHYVTDLVSKVTARLKR